MTNEQEGASSEGMRSAAWALFALIVLVAAYQCYFRYEYVLVPASGDSFNVVFRIDRLRGGFTCIVFPNPYDPGYGCWQSEFIRPPTPTPVISP
jgi:hypothetical protein